MHKYLNCYTGYHDPGNKYTVGIAIVMCNCDKYFLPGDKVKIKIRPQGVKVLDVLYSWKDGDLNFGKVLFNHCTFNARVPKKIGNTPVLNVRVKLQIPDGSIEIKEMDFDINNIEG